MNGQYYTPAMRFGGRRGMAICLKFQESWSKVGGHAARDLATVLSVKYFLVTVGKWVKTPPSQRKVFRHIPAIHNFLAQRAIKFS